MRILFAFAGGSGHLDPLIPLARAAEANSHDVAFASRSSMVATVEAHGFSVFPIGRDEPEIPERTPLQPLDADREDRVLREGFARAAGRERASGVLARCDEWGPDLIVCSEADYGSMIAAELRDLPYAVVLDSAAGSFIRPEVIAEPLHELRAEHGLAPDPALEMLSRFLVLSPFPPSFRDPRFPLPPTAHSIKPLLIRPTDEVPPWIEEHGDRPTVYVTLGTVFNMESGDLFSRMIAGCRELPVNVVVTVGRHLDPEEFGSQPANVRIERYIPQALLLPRCDVVVSHAGSGSVMGALAHGLPSVLIPMGADQPHNAGRCKALGAGLVLEAISATPEDVRDAVSELLEDPTYRRAAERIRAEIDALPGIEHALDLLERLAAEKRPLLAR